MSCHELEGSCCQQVSHRLGVPLTVLACNRGLRAIITVVGRIVEVHVARDHPALQVPPPTSPPPRPIVQVTPHPAQLLGNSMSGGPESHQSNVFRLWDQFQIAPPIKDHLFARLDPVDKRLRGRKIC